MTVLWVNVHHPVLYEVTNIIVLLSLVGIVEVIAKPTHIVRV